MLSEFNAILSVGQDPEDRKLMTLLIKLLKISVEQLASLVLQYAPDLYPCLHLLFVMDHLNSHQSRHLAFESRPPVTPRSCIPVIITFIKNECD